MFRLGTYNLWMPDLWIFSPFTVICLTFDALPLNVSFNLTFIFTPSPLNLTLMLITLHVQGTFYDRFIFRFILIFANFNYGVPGSLFLI